MAEHHSPSEDFEDQSQLNSVDDDQLDPLENKTVQRINDLMYQDKMAVLLEVVNVTVKHLNAQKENKVLQKAIEKVMDEKAILEKKLLDEKQILESIASLEAQGKSLIGNLNNEYELINGQVKSIRGVRTQLKSEIAMSRTSIETLSKRIVAMVEKANKQFMEYSANMTGWKASRSELNAKNVELQNQNESLRAARDADLANVETIKQHQTEIKQLSDKIAQMNNEQQQERRVLDEQKTTISRLQNEKKESDEQCAQLKLANERELATMHAKLVDSNNQIAILKKTCAVNEQKILELNEKVRKLEADNIALTNKKGSMKSEISNLNDQLKKTTARIKELELESKTQNAMPNKKAGPSGPAFALPFGKPSIVGNYRPIDEPSKIKKVQDKNEPSYDYSLMENSYHHDNELSIVPSSGSSSCIAYEKR